MMESACITCQYSTFAICLRPKIVSFVVRLKVDGMSVCKLINDQKTSSKTQMIYFYVGQKWMQNKQKISKVANWVKSVLNSV